MTQSSTTAHSAVSLLDSELKFEQAKRALAEAQPSQKGHKLVEALDSYKWTEEGAQSLAEYRRDLRALAKAHALVVPATMPLAGGLTGYFTPGRLDDCWRAAVATVLQVPVEEIPDVHADAHLFGQRESLTSFSRRAWRIYERWLARRGLRMIEVTRRPWPEGLWAAVGYKDVSSAAAGKMYEEHIVVMQGDRVIHDPSAPPQFQPQAQSRSPLRVVWGVRFARSKGAQDGIHR